MNVTSNVSIWLLTINLEASSPSGLSLSLFVIINSLFPAGTMALSPSGASSPSGLSLSLFVILNSLFPAGTKGRVRHPTLLRIHRCAYQRFFHGILCVAHTFPAHNPPQLHGLLRCADPTCLFVCVGHWLDLLKRSPVSLVRRCRFPNRCLRAHLLVQSPQCHLLRH